MSRVTLHSLDVLLSQFWSSPLFHVLTVAFWPAYLFLRRQIRWSGISISLRIFQFVVIHIVKGVTIVNDTEVEFFLEFSYFLYGPINISILSSGSSAFLKSISYIWKFSVQVQLKSTLKDFEYNLAIMWNEHNCTVVRILFGIALLWDWNENWPLPVLWPLLHFLNLLIYRV